MITRIFGKANTGRSLYSLKRLLEHESDICFISLEMSNKIINKRIKRYIDNYHIDNNFQINKDIFSNIFITSDRINKLSDLFFLILKINKKRKISTFLIDSIYMIGNPFPDIEYIYQEFYNFSKEYNIDIIINDQERISYTENRLKCFFEDNNLENIKINKTSGGGGVYSNVSLELGDKLFTDSISCFFKKTLDEIRDKKIDFILS